MKKLNNWEVVIEYGPVHNHVILVKNSTKEDALQQAKDWVQGNNIQNPIYSVRKQIISIPEDSILDDDYSDIIEWTPEEEEEFLRIADRGNIDQN